MRVIAGTSRGCGLVSLKGQHTRPTGDRLKENLFNLLAPYMMDARFLDLFSGSGAIGIEALSRGAREAVFVEQYREAAHVIKTNLVKTHLESRAELLIKSVKQSLTWLASENRCFDLIFMDPPYDSGLVTETLQQLMALRHVLLHKNSVLIAEMSAGTDAPELDNFILINRKIYGNTQFVFYTLKAGQL